MDKMKLARAAALLAACLAPAAGAQAGGLDNVLPAPEGLMRYGCVVQGPIAQIDHGNPTSRSRHVWAVSFWAEHRGPFTAKAPPEADQPRAGKRDWKLLYSFRKNRRKGLLDCDKFMERVKRSERAHPRIEAGKLVTRASADASAGTKPR